LLFFTQQLDPTAQSSPFTVGHFIARQRATTMLLISSSSLDDSAAPE
jgi:hypothetical protein